MTSHEPGDPQDKTTKNPHGPLTIPCENCHTAAGWRPVRQVPEFDHNKTNYPLRGLHEKVPCVQCHVKPVFKNVGKNCADCHQDIHRRQMGSDCAQCHTVQGWDIAVQQVKDHQNRFPLLGAHAAVQCEDCHKQAAAGIFYGLSTECQSCHLKDWQTTTNPPHAADPTDFAPSNCQGCHQTFDSWLGASFSGNHAAPPINFPLTLGHANLPCQQCHINNNYHLQIAATDCGNAGCHLTTWQQTNNPPHPSAGPIFAITNCSNCHNPSSWTNVVFDHSTTGFPLTNGHANLQCSQCHINNNYNLQIRPTDCGNSGCHLTKWQQTNNPVHSTAGPAFASANCSQCHDTIAWTDMTSFNHAVTGFTLTGAHVTTPCIQCHVNNNYTLQIAPTDCGNAGCHLTQWNSTQTLGGSVPNHITAGFPIAQCSTCHNTTSWANATFNHSTTGFPLTNSHQMAPAGKVTACSQCHINNNYNLQIQPTDCGNAGCHLTTWQTTNNPAHASAPQTFAIANCSPCHDTIAWTDSNGFNHSSTGLALVGTHATTPCAQCHVNNNYSLTSADCMGCHLSSWNSTKTLGGNVPNHVAANFPTTAAACSTCHSITTWADGKFDHSSTGFPLTNSHQMAPAGKVTACTQCHVGGNYNLTSTACYPCHTTDWNNTPNFGGAVPNHITSNFPQTCETCHDTIVWTDATFNHNNTGFPLTGLHVTVQCALCHSAAAGGYTLKAPSGCADANCHASDYANTNNPVHPAAAAGFPPFAAGNCANCHSTAAAFTTTSWSHSSTPWPLTGNHQMAPAGVSTNCNQCHVGNNYSLTTGDCWNSGCHTTDWNNTATMGGAVPNHVAAYFPTSLCSTCHDTLLWADGKFDHSTTGWALTGGHIVPTAGGVQACTDCHVSNNYSLTSANTVCYLCHLAQWNSTQTLGGTVPNHITAGYPTTCDSCHTTTNWLGAVFNHTYFPIPHHGSVCADCHQVATDYSQFTCINCHTTTAHQQTQTNNQHGGVGGYTYGPTTCYNCHKNGGGG